MRSEVSEYEDDSGMRPEGRRRQIPGRRRDSLLLRTLRYLREFYDLDAQGGTSQEALSEWLKEVDVVVISTRTTTSRGIEPLTRMRKAVLKHGRAKIVYVMSGWNHFKASCEVRRACRRPDGGHTAQSEAFAQAGAAGVSVVEFDRRGKAARATCELVDTVRETAGFPAE